MSEEIRDRVDTRLQDLSDTVSEHRSWFLYSSIALIALGILAIFFPLVTTIAAKVMLDWVILIGGAIQTFHAFSSQYWSGLFYELLVGLIFVFAGGWLAFFPLTGIITLTVMLALVFILKGAVESALAFRLKPRGSWGWFLFSGIISIVAGIMLLTGLPSTADWAIGLLAGISMISTGWAYISLAMRVGKARQAVNDRLGRPCRAAI